FCQLIRPYLRLNEAKVRYHVRRRSATFATRSLGTCLIARPFVIAFATAYNSARLFLFAVDWRLSINRSVACPINPSSEAPERWYLNCERETPRKSGHRQHTASHHRMGVDSASGFRCLPVRSDSFSGL